ncbi:MAG: DNA primase DnaG [Candidatus Methanomethylophilaceae archaeon]|nr:DNA primase DnaG [Candidatus Methanomethylophilaceae archaeon]MDD3378489.1 DNA primase DnaG [Candidatus Methanomethylophilaceae archaeon]MDY0224151.1 DNA primase DnaG [Candidatus Methanomethylophilaceae archaeon]
MNIDPNATKYMIKAKITADGVVEKPDVVGAIFGQTEGLLGDDLDLRDLQKSGRIGRIEVEIVSKGGKSEGIIYMASSLDQVETVILASALETIDRVGPCKAGIRILGIEDVRITKREKVVERAKELLVNLIAQSKGTSSNLTQSIRQSIQVEEITSYGKDRCPAGPAVKDSESIIIVEGRSDVLNLLRAGIKNGIAVEGTNIPKTVQDLSRERVSTAFVDGDRGGELILRELFQTSEIDFVARAPRAHEVEELTSKQLVKCLRNKVPGDQYMEMNGMVTEEKELSGDSEAVPLEQPRRDFEEKPKREHDDRREREDRHERRDNRNDRSDRTDRSERSDRSDRPKREIRIRDSDSEERPKNRFSSENADRFKKKVFVEKEPVVEPVAVEEQILEPVAEPVVESVIEEQPVEVVVKELKPRRERTDKSSEDKSSRTLRGKKDRNTKTLSEEQIAFRDMLLDMSSTHNAKLLSADNSIIRDVAVKSLVNSLKEDSEGVVAIVFDGVISQRIMDVSSEKGIRTVVGTRKGNITKMPADITIWTKENLY